MQRAYVPLFKPYGLTYVQYLVLLVLWETDDRRVSDIGRRLYLDSGTLTPVLRRLERLGYVERRRSTVDERTVRVRLTSEGVALENDMHAVRESITLKAGLDGSAFEALRDQLRALRGQLTEIVPAPSETSPALPAVSPATS